MAEAVVVLNVLPPLERLTRDWLRGRGRAEKLESHNFRVGMRRDAALTDCIPVSLESAGKASGLHPAKQMYYIQYRTAQCTTSEWQHNPTLS